MVALVLVISAKGVARADAGRDHGENASGRRVSKKGVPCASLYIYLYRDSTFGLPLRPKLDLGRAIATEPRSLFEPAHRVRC
jgi:hypothetical protein